MRYFIDTEFCEDGKTIELLSVGIVAGDRRELYLVNEEADTRKANEFVKEHVLPKLNTFRYEPGLYVERCTRRRMREVVLDFCNHDGHKPRFWGYYCDYDWVALCQLFGRMVDLPIHWPKYCRDLKQLLDMCGNPNVSNVVRRPDPEHHALFDARHERDVFEWLERTVHPAARQEIFRYI